MKQAAIKVQPAQNTGETPAGLLSFDKPTLKKDKK